MELFLGYLKDGRAVVYQNSSTWVVCDFVTEGISFDNTDKVSLKTRKEISDLWKGGGLELLCPDNCPYGEVLDSFGVCDYCVGCGEWFPLSELIEDPEHEEDHYCKECAINYQIF